MYFDTPENTPTYNHEENQGFDDRFETIMKDCGNDCHVAIEVYAKEIGETVQQVTEWYDAGEL